MAFTLFAESFGAYKLGAISDPDIKNDILSRWTVATGTSCNIIDTGRNGPGVQLANFQLLKTLVHSSVWTGGFAIMVTGSSNGNNPIFKLSNNDQDLFIITHNIDGTLAVRAGATNIIGVSSRALHQDIWYWVDFTITLSGSSPVTCTAELRINSYPEVSDSASTNINKADLLSNDATANNFSFLGVTGVGTSILISDFYTKNSSGYYGDVVIQPLLPNGDVVTDWTPSTGSSHYVLINTIKPIDRTKYISSATIDQQAIFDWQDCPGFSGTIKAINIRFMAKKDDMGEKSFKIVTGDTGTEDASDEFFVSDLSEEYYEHSLENDPATSMPWTQVGFNAKRFGVKLIS